MKKKKLSTAISFILLAIAAICGFFYYSECSTAQKEVAEYVEVQSSYTTMLTESIKNGNPADYGALPETAGLPYAVVDFDALLLANLETVGWLAIPDTDISYPVLQTKNNSKYLSTSFGGGRSGAGAIFMDYNNSAEPLDSNTILYGHTMGRGRADMFGPLHQYKDQAYYETHAYLQFDTVHQQYGWWKVFAVVNLDVKMSEFDYLQQNFQGEVAFEAWIAQAKALSLYDTDVDVSTGDKILTLSTCDRSVSKNGRLLIMAVWVGRGTP